MSWRHGTFYGYQDKGCRCAECRAYVAKKRKAWRAKRGPGYLNELAKAREYKQRLTGICERCGGTTRYGGQSYSVNGVGRICQSCAHQSHERCARGHLLIPENRVRVGGKRNRGTTCRLCQNERMRLYLARKRREAGVPEHGPYRKSKKRIALEAAIQHREDELTAEGKVI
jgi:hypothetical protein